MGAKKVETFAQRTRRELAQADKAWKLIHALRGMHPDYVTDAELIEIVQLMDDREWDQARDYAKVKAHKPVMVEDSTNGSRHVDTSCSVSHTVKAKVYQILRDGQLYTPVIAGPGEDALPPVQRTGHLRAV